MYERKLAAWRRRLDRIVARLDTRLAEERKRLASTETAFRLAAAANLLIVTIPLAAPAALLLHLRVREIRARIDSLRIRRNLIHATPEPPYKPQSPEPHRAVRTEAPKRPRLIPIPEHVDLREKWWACLRKPPPWLHNEEGHREGDAGEALLLKAFAEVLGDMYIAIPGAKVERGLDGDLVIIGGNGVWVFDSKYLAGEITYNGAVWKHRKLIPYKGGRGAKEWVERPIGDLSEEWLREYQSVDFTLKKNMRRSFPRVTGGLVFTYKGAELNIRDDCPVAWGTIESWVDRLVNTPHDIHFTERDLVECAHHILNFSHRMEGDDAASAYDMAETVYSAASSEHQQFKARSQLE